MNILAVCHSDSKSQASDLKKIQVCANDLKISILALDCELESALIHICLPGSWYFLYHILSNANICVK